ncbi:hypothetical protein Scep_007481 [Stephania cephalantha]|uniref:Uncharacterized protein n=1 Tax=Stephania cephalantha TaxID=152367 RepID=A0AAP0KBP9_9MAGN
MRRKSVRRKLGNSSKAWKVTTTINPSKALPVHASVNWFCRSIYNFILKFGLKGCIVGFMLGNFAASTEHQIINALLETAPELPRKILTKVEAAKLAAAAVVLILENCFLRPGCSSIGFGEAGEIGSFHINAEGKTLYLNPYSWNQGKVLYCFIWLRWAVGFSNALVLHLPIVKSDHRLYYLRCKDRDLLDLIETIISIVCIRGSTGGWRSDCGRRRTGGRRHWDARLWEAGQVGGAAVGCVAVGGATVGGAIRGMRG